jgi:uncharacterized repeat protein (TIGR01451 family)
VPAVWDPGQQVTYIARYTTTQADVKAGKVGFDISAGAADPNDAPVIATADDTIVPLATAQVAHLIVAQVNDCGGFSKAGDVIKYVVVVQNDGTVPLRSIAIAASVPGTLTPDAAIPAILNPGDQITWTGSYTVTQADLTAGKVISRVTVSALDPNSRSVSAADNGIATRTVPTNDELNSILVSDLNSIISRGTLIYNPTLFAGVTLSQDTTDLLHQYQDFRFDSPHGLVAGDQVFVKGTGTPYYAIPVDDNTIQLAASQSDALAGKAIATGAGTSPGAFFTTLPSTEGMTFRPSDVSGFAITTSLAHGLHTGDAVIYHNGGGTSIGGLIDGKTYYVDKISDTCVALALTPELAEINEAFPIIPGLATGSNHTLVRKLSYAGLSIDQLSTLNHYLLADAYPTGISAAQQSIV